MIRFVALALGLLMLDYGFGLRIPRIMPAHASTHLQQSTGFLTAQMDSLNALNAELLAIREGEQLGKSTGGVGTLTKISGAVAQVKGVAVGRLLELEGCLSISNVLSAATARSLLAFINEENVRCEAEVDAGVVPFDERFGGVNCRGRKVKYGQRRDLYMPMTSPIVRAALKEAFGNLEPMLHKVVGQAGMLHEVSCVISDPESPRQCVHADTIVLPCPQYPQASMEPLYTFFIALQDVEDGMGHTVFIPKTHTPEAHLLWNAGDAVGKMKFLGLQKVVQSKLQMGDCSAFDSRVLHCGRENSSDKRRVLFYFTISRQHDWPLPNGLHGSNSMRVEDRWKYTLDQF